MKGFSPGLHTKNKSRFLIFFYAFIALLTGAIIYLFRPVKPFFLNHFNTSGWKLFNLKHFPFPEWILYSLPDGLWAFAYTVLIITIWKGQFSPVRYLWYASIPILIFGFEMLQLTGKFPGTFCLFDLAFCSAGIIAGIIITKNKINKS